MLHSGQLERVEHASNMFTFVALLLGGGGVGDASLSTCHLFDNPSFQFE